ncbi:MAG: hypothetical protein MJD61_15890 [Proteobacteria bacterium]|nr:hypothetical protein [Pseudomonadota bacterium]
MRERANELRLVREAAEAEQAEKERRQAAAARKRHLAALTKQGAKAWKRLERLIEDRKYDEAVKLTVDLRDAALSLGRAGEFRTQIAAVRKQHARRRGYLDRLRGQLDGSSRGTLVTGPAKRILRRSRGAR